MVVLRPGGYPVATNAKDNEETKEVQYIEDVDATEGNQMQVLTWKRFYYLFIHFYNLNYDYIIY